MSSLKKVARDKDKVEFCVAMCERMVFDPDRRCKSMVAYVLLKVGKFKRTKCLRFLELYAPEMTKAMLHQAVSWLPPAERAKFLGQKDTRNRSK